MTDREKLIRGGFCFDSDRDCQAARDLLGIIDAQRAQLEVINTPELVDFQSAVLREAQHQRLRWPSDHDSGKTPPDWFWLVGYLAGKALASHLKGDNEKALHHTITVAAACANWHAAILGLTDMRPGIETPLV